MANVHVDRLGEINWNHGISHDDLTAAGLITKRVQTQMQLAAHPQSAERANVRLVGANGASERAVRIPMREIIYNRPVQLARTVGLAVFSILKADEHADFDPGFPAIHTLTLDELVRASVLTPRTARQINLADLGVQPEEAKATINFGDGSSQSFVRTPLVGGREYPSALEVAMDVSMGMQAILTGQEIYQQGTARGVIIDIA